MSPQRQQRKEVAAPGRKRIPAKGWFERGEEYELTAG